MAQDPAKKELLHKDEEATHEGEQNPIHKEVTIPSLQIPKSQNEIPEKSETKNTLEVEELPPDGELKKESSSENPMKRKAKGWAFLQKGKALGTIVKNVSTNNNNSLENQVNHYLNSIYLFF